MRFSAAAAPSASLRALLVGACFAVLAAGAKDPLDCEVCLAAVATIRSASTAAGAKDLIAIEAQVEKYCDKPPTEKEGKLCYYIAPIKRELSQPIKNGVPNEKICERLKKSSAEICALRFAAAPSIPPASEIADFSKLRVKDLKQIMAEKGIKCPDCLEKDDFVRRLSEAKEKNEL